MTKTSAELEREVEATRDNLDRTVEALRGKMSPGQLVDEVSAVMGEGGRQVVARLSDHARQNPLPLALIGLGVAWLMIGGNRRPYGRADALYESHDRDGVSLPDKIGETLHEVAGSVAGAAQSARDAVARRAADASLKASALKADAAERLALARHKVSARYTETLESEPLILGAIGLAVGLAAGAAVPASAVEDRYLGRLHDDVVDKVQAFAGEHLHTARDVGAAVYTAAKGAIKQAVEATPNPESHETEMASTTSSDTPATPYKMGERA